MAERRAPRFDAYGKPRPTLANAGEQALLDSGANLEARRFIQDVLQETYRAYLRRGMSLTVEIRFTIADGTIQPQAYVETTRKYSGITSWRQPKEEIGDGA